MRIALALLPLAAAAPAAAAPPQPPATAEVQRLLNDPATADKMANVMQALSQAFLNLPIGDVEAAVEGRAPTPADRTRTIRTENPNIDRDLDAQIAQSRPMMRQGMKAMADALPGMMKGFKDAQKSFERALSNMPDPTYPKR
jgi:hypothetical protein